MLVFIEDTREPDGLGYSAILTEENWKRMPLKTGDYSIEGYEDKIAIERKATLDLVASLTHNRKRFEEELERSMDLDFFCVIIEGDASNVYRGRYSYKHNSKAHPRAIWETIATFWIRYKAPFVFCSDKYHGSQMAKSLLSKYVREITKRP